MSQPRRPARLIDVATLAGVSPGTASKALNNTGFLKDSTRDRVRAAADRIGFIPDARARSLHARRTFTVGLLSADSAGRFSLPVVLGAENALLTGQVSALLATARQDPAREQHHIRSLVSHRVDGIIVTGRTTEPRAPVDAPVPVVYAFAPSRDPEDASVVPDEADGMVQVIDHLHALGHRRIAYIGGPVDQLSSTIRYSSAFETATARGIEVSGEPLYGDWSERWGRHAVDVLLDGTRGQPGAIDAIVCASDQIARGATDRLRERGLRVPEDIAVTGYDDWAPMSLASRPPLTTVDMRLESLGQRAAERLLAAVSGEPFHGLDLVRPRLVTRESTLGTS